MPLGEAYSAHQHHIYQCSALKLLADLLDDDQAGGIQGFVCYHLQARASLLMI
jgi:hypothetical protein